MSIEMFVPGQGSGGPVINKLMESNFNVGVLRPYINADGAHCITTNVNGEEVEQLTANADSLLRYDEWKRIDDIVLKVGKERLNYVKRLEGKGLTYDIPNGLGISVLTTERMSDISRARISMDAVNDSDNDRPKFDTVNLPMPVTYKDFFISSRQLATGRNVGAPLDTLVVEQAAEKVAEEIERLYVGTLDDYVFAGGTVYGLLNFTDRLTATITSPTASGWTGQTLLDEILAMRAQSVAAKYYGPFEMFVAPNWDRYLDADYSTAKGDNTLRERIKKIHNIEEITTLDYMTNYDIALQQMTSNVVRSVTGLGMTTVQWPEKGGLMQCFKVMAIMVPQMRSDQNGNTGIVIGSV